MEADFARPLISFASGQLGHAAIVSTTATLTATLGGCAAAKAAATIHG